MDAFVAFAGAWSAAFSATGSVQPFFAAISRPSRVAGPAEGPSFSCPSRKPARTRSFSLNVRVLAGFLDGHEDEGPSAGRSTLLGREIAAAKGWTEPVAVEVADEAADTKGEEAK